MYKHSKMDAEERKYSEPTFPDNELMNVAFAVNCNKHKAARGEPCYWIPCEDGGHAAICNGRVKHAGHARGTILKAVRPKTSVKTRS